MIHAALLKGSGSIIHLGEYNYQAVKWHERAMLLILIFTRIFFSETKLEMSHKQCELS